MSEFTIYALTCANGIIALSSLPGRSGQYEEDLAHLRAWQPAIVISMTTHRELEAFGSPSFGLDVQAMGARWAHVPIADYGAPSPEAEDNWDVVASAALDALAGGGRVLAHCRGGCGRSGMAVLRLMIEAGEHPGTALIRLRSVRPCAVETEAQMQWALAAHG